MKEAIYDLNSLFIAAILFFAMVVAIEAGNWVGRINYPSTRESARAHVNSVQASLLGVMALLLGFTFSLALQRFDSRSAAVVDEANAIGTTYMRAQLLPASVSGEVRTLLRRYVDLRARAGEVPLDQEEARRVLLAESSEVVDALWKLARLAAQEDNSPVTTGLFIQSLNEAIDSYGRRDAEINRHVPELILMLMFGTFVLTGVVVGYAPGVGGGDRPPFVTYILVLLVVILTFTIIDLDRPRRGLIRVDQTSLAQLKASIDRSESGAAAAVPAGNGPVLPAGSK